MLSVGVKLCQNGPLTSTFPESAGESFFLLVLPAPGKRVDPVKEIFQINAPGIDVQALIREVEADTVRRFGADESARVASLSFTPSPSRGGAFDPVDTGELFERPVDSPDFQSAKYRFVKGPLRWVARFLFKWASALFDKLSENKVLAFYHVVHEAIALNHRLGRLSDEIQSLVAENMRLRAALMEGGTPPSADRTASVSIAAGENDAWNRTLAEHVSQNARLITIDDTRAVTLLQLKAAGFSRLTCTDADILEAAWTNRNLGLSVTCAAADQALFALSPGSVDAVLFPEIARTTGPADEALRLCASRLPTGGYLILRHRPADETNPFRPRHAYVIDEPRLLDFLAKLGFTISSHESDSTRPGSFQIVSRKA